MKLILGLLIGILPQFAQCETITIVDNGGCGQAAYTFDNKSISSDRFNQLLTLSPFQHGKWMPLEVIERCIPNEPGYRSCDMSNVHNQLFFDNAEVTQKILTARMTSLNELRAPAELKPIVDYLMAENSFVFWVNSIRLKFYKTWRTDALEACFFIKPTKKVLDTKILCRDLLDGLSTEKDVDKLFSATTGGLNCVNTEFQHNVAYSSGAWNSFLKASHITVKETEEKDCD